MLQADIQYWNETLFEELETIRSLVDKASNSTDNIEKASLVEQTDKNIHKSNGTRRLFKLEYRLFSDPNAKRQYAQQLAHHEQDLQTIQQENTSLKSNNSKQELFDAANIGASPQQDGDSLLKGTGRIQDKTQEYLDNTKQLVEEIKETEMNTLGQLHQQREQIERIENDVDCIEDNLMRADYRIKMFSKHMATDKLIQGFIVLMLFHSSLLLCWPFQKNFSVCVCAFIINGRK